MGSAIQALEQQGKLKQIKQLYNDSDFFRALIDNCEMAMKKCFFPLTEHLSQHPRFGELWNKIYGEYELTIRSIFKISGKTELMADYPVEQLSIQMRERIVLPLITIQQYAMSQIMRIKEDASNNPINETFEKLVIRCSFGIINAGRNSA